MNEKDTLLFLGERVKCSIKDGMAWHLDIPGYTLLELLEHKYNILKGAPDQWSVRSGKLHLRNQPVQDELLNKRVRGAFFYYKNQPKQQVENLREGSCTFVTSLFRTNYLISVFEALSFITKTSRSNR